MDRPADANVYVGLVLRGDFQPASVSERLGLLPTLSYARGDQFGTRLRRHSAWNLWSDDKVDAETIEPHLGWLLDVIEPKATALRAVLADASVDGYADCYWESSGLSGGPWIAPETMGRLAALDLPLVISFYGTQVAH